MAATKGKPVELETRLRPSEGAGAELLNDLVFLALPTPLFKALSDEAAKRQKTLAEFLADAVTVAVSTPSLLTESKE